MNHCACKISELSLHFPCFHKDMVVHNVGSGLATVFPDLDGKKINDAFLLARPLVEFTWNMVRRLVSLRV